LEKSQIALGSWVDFDAVYQQLIAPTIDEAAL
jgi:hypothetical protein